MFNNKLIEELKDIKSEIEKYDTGHLYHQFSPNVPASEENIREVEKRLGFSLDEQYRDFLKIANGWTNFLQTITLFGTMDLIGSELFAYARQGIEHVWDEDVESIGFSKDEILPIAATLNNTDLFLMTKTSSVEPGIIIWLAGYEIERYNGFNDFFYAMIKYNRMDLEDFKING